MRFSWIGLLLFVANVWAAQQPNVLFILVDDLGYSDVAC